MYVQAAAWLQSPPEPGCPESLPPPTAPTPYPHQDPPSLSPPYRLQSYPLVYATILTRPGQVKYDPAGPDRRAYQNGSEGNGRRQGFGQEATAAGGQWLQPW